MSATLLARGLAAGHGDRVLFTDLDLVVAPGDVVGLVGVNGAGKSTLLRILAGRGPGRGRHDRRSARRRRPSATCRRRPSGGRARRCGLPRPADRGRRGPGGAWTPPPRRWPRARRAPTTTTRDALERWLALGGADLAERAEEVVAEVGPGRRPGRARWSALSGGQAARVGLASLLLSRYDVFLLDEPTNDLDLDGLDRLERFVTGLRAGAVLVSHDREFLARTVTRVRRARPGPAAGARATAAATRPTWASARWPAGTPARSSRSTPTPRPAWRSGPGCSAPGWRRASATPVRKAHATGQDRAHMPGRGQREAGGQGPADRTADRAAGGGRGAAQGVGAADGDRRGAAGGRGGGDAARRRGAARRRSPSGPVDLQVDWADRVGDHRGERLGQVHPAGRAARPGAAGRGRRRRSAPGVVVGEVDQARGLFLGDEPLARRVRRGGARPAPTPRCARCWPSSGCGADHVLRPAAHAVAGRADPGGAGAAAGPRGEPAGARRADQPPRPAGDRAAGVGAGRPTRARCCWSPTTAGCSRRCTPPGGSWWTRAGCTRADRRRRRPPGRGAGRAVCAVRAWGGVPPAGFEPAPLPPEGSALSPELRGLVRGAPAGRRQNVTSRRHAAARRRASGRRQRAAAARAEHLLHRRDLRASAVSAIDRASAADDGLAGVRPRRTAPSAARPGGGGSSAAGTSRRTAVPVSDASWASSASVAIPGITRRRAAGRHVSGCPAMPAIQPIGVAGSVGGRPHSASQPCIRPTWLVWRGGDVEGQPPDSRVGAAVGGQVGHLHRLQVVPRHVPGEARRRPSRRGRRLGPPDAERHRQPAAEGEQGRRAMTATSTAVQPDPGRAAASVGRRSSVAGHGGRLGSPRCPEAGAVVAGASVAVESAPAAWPSRRPAGADEGRVLAAGADLGVEVRVERHEVDELLHPLVGGRVDGQLVVPGLQADRRAQPRVGRQHVGRGRRPGPSSVDRSAVAMAPGS